MMKTTFNLDQIDKLRAQLLKFTLKFDFLRLLFLNRSQRILFLGTAALIFYFSASLFFPLWILVLGPIIWGVPHIFSSLRYNTIHMEENIKSLLLKSLSVIWFCVFAYRFCVDILQYSLPLAYNYLAFEMIALVISFVMIAFLNRLSWTLKIVYAIIFSSLVILTVLHPIQVGLTLLIGHNYIPLANWFKSCTTKSDRHTFYLLATTYVLVSVGIFSGAFDGLFQLQPRQTDIEIFGWNFMDVVTPFGATESTALFWYRIVVLYAFSQSIHYFIWLKAIPENFQRTEFPPSFKWTFNRLTNDFGKSGLLFLSLTLIAGLLIWVGFEFQTARYVYFGIASYHGFMELAGLATFGKSQHG